MIKINRGQADYIRQNAKNARVNMTGKHKKSRAKRWYVDESREALRLLAEYDALCKSL